jgi:hypothetical protein
MAPEDIYVFFSVMNRSRRRNHSLYYAGFRCWNRSEYSAASCSIFNSCLVNSSIIAVVEGCKERGSKWLSGICLAFRSRFQPLDWLPGWWLAVECSRAYTSKNMFSNHHFWRESFLYLINKGYVNNNNNITYMYDYRRGLDWIDLLATTNNYNTIALYNPHFTVHWST